MRVKTSGNRPLTTIPGLDIPTSQNNWAKDDFTFDKYVHFMPQMNLVVSVGATKNKLTLIPFNVLEGMKTFGASISS